MLPQCGFNMDFSLLLLLSAEKRLVPFVDFFSALCGNGMLESMLEPHLQSIGSSTIDAGITFLIFGYWYMVGNMFFRTVSGLDLYYFLYWEMKLQMSLQ